ncbi:ATP-binding protein [Haloferax namakaokahaiae]|uniref:Chemotaxis protein CheA n=1 Tax=Haloferax namakaokahaiae TaxID=1748331 RepID=A0ABD5ZH57_9EURY
MSRDDEFVREARASLRRLTNGLVELERDGSSRELVDELFRTAHTLKGNCSMAGLAGAAQLAHALEDFLSDLRDGSLSPNPDLIDAGLAAADDIDAMLDEWSDHASVETTPDSSASMLRAAMERHRDESADTGATASSPETPDSSASMPADLEDEFDSSVVDALESASGFDDLEGLLAEMDDSDVDDPGVDDDPDRWGTFDSSGDATSEAPADETPNVGAQPNVTNDFEAIKNDVQRDDISDLDRELVDVEFGEFDHDDELSIQDLIEGELDEEDPLAEADDRPVEGDILPADDTQASGSPSTDSSGPTDAISPADLGYTASDEATADDASTPGGSPAVDADETAAPADAATADTEDENPFEGADIIDPDEPRADTAVSADGDVLGEDGSNAITAESFDFSSDPAPLDDEEPMEIESEVDDEFDISFPDGETFGPGGDDSEGDADPEEPELEPSEDAFDLVQDVELAGDRPDEEGGLREGVPRFPDEDFGLSDSDAADETALDTDFAVNDSEELAADSTADESAEPGLAEVDLPDIDELTGSSLETDFDATESAPEISFQRDEDTMAFESRFAERFGSRGDDDEVPLVQAAAATIEESSLDSARYQPSRPVEYPIEFNESSESDQIQSLTVDVQSADTLLNLVEELSLMQLRIKQGDEADLDEQLAAMESVTGDLRRAVMNLRLMPLSTATGGLQRVVRDIARQQNKQVAFDVSDDGVHLDRSIVEKLGDPLVHLVRNAIDHGIEPPEARRRQDKPPEGSIELRAWRDRERVVIEVEDDGRGISAARIRQQAIDHGIVTRERAEQLSLDEVYDLVFEPGFSTAEAVTDVSGRGVGMDAVRRAVNSIEGTVGITSDPGSGTTVRIRLPVSVAVAKMLFVGVGSEQYAIPASVVDDVEHVDEEALTDDGLVTVEWPDQTVDRPDQIPYRHLGAALGVESDDERARIEPSSAADESEERPVLVRLDPDTRELAFLCDEVDDAREVVVRPYEKLLGDVPGMSGATMSGDGTLVNIIDVTTL